MVLGLLFLPLQLTFVYYLYITQKFVVKSKYAITFLDKYYLPVSAYVIQAGLFFITLFSMGIESGDYSFVNNSSGLYPQSYI